jgi:hypothetical protein
MVKKMMNCSCKREERVRGEVIIERTEQRRETTP